MDDTNKVVEPVAEVVIDPIAAKDAEIAKLAIERDNYKAVALKRLGKLPGDAEFIDKDGTGLSVVEQVRLALLDKEIESVEKQKQTETAKILKENAELRLALKNRPQSGIGGGSGSVALEVKDNVLSEQQVNDLKKRAERLNVKDVNAFIEKAKANLQKNR